MSNNQIEELARLNAFSPFYLIGGAVAGAGTASEWLLGNLSAIMPTSWAGSALMGAVGGFGIAFLLFTLRTWRSWRIVIVGLSLDMVLSGLFVLPLIGLGISDALSLWPYLLGTVATFLAGIAVGYLAPKAPLRHAIGIVLLDFLLAGLIGFFVPFAATWTLVSRIIAALCAVSVGGAIGQYAYFAIKKDPNELGRFLGRTCLAVFTSAAGGVVTWLVIGA